MHRVEAVVGRSFASSSASSRFRFFSTSATTTKTSTLSNSLSPAVLWHVRANNIDVASIQGSGPRGRLLKGDVLLALERHTAKFISPQQPHPLQHTPSTRTIEQLQSGRRSRSFIDIPLSTAFSPSSSPSTTVSTQSSSFRSVTNKTIPHAYASIEVKLNQFVRACNLLAADHASSSSSSIPTEVDLLVKAVARVTRDMKLVQPMTALDVLVLSSDSCYLVSRADRLPLTLINKNRSPAVVPPPTLITVSNFNECETRPILLSPNIMAFNISRSQPVAVAVASASASAAAAAAAAASNSATTSSKPASASLEVDHACSVSMAFDERVVDDATAAAFLDNVRKHMQFLL